MRWLSENLFRKDLNLEKRWWHRLAKIFFVIFSAIILVSSIFGFYSTEEYHAREYKIIKKFDQYVQEQKSNCINEPSIKTENHPSYPIGQAPWETSTFSETPLSFKICSYFILPNGFLLEDTPIGNTPQTIPFGASSPNPTPQEYPLGCLTKNGEVEYLSEFSFKEGVVCSQGPDYNCTIPKNICGGIASNIVKYDYEIKGN